MADNTGTIGMTEEAFPGMGGLTVIYIEESDTLKMHNGDTSGAGETIANLVHVYHDKNDEVSGVCIIGASHLFTDDVLDAMKRRRGGSEEGDELS